MSNGVQLRSQPALQAPAVPERADRVLSFANSVLLVVVAAVLCGVLGLLWDVSAQLGAERQRLAQREADGAASATAAAGAQKQLALHQAALALQQERTKTLNEENLRLLGIINENLKARSRE